jgi:hypothetical protein
MYEAAVSTGVGPDRNPISPEMMAKLNAIPAALVEQLTSSATNEDPFEMQLKLVAAERLGMSDEDVASRVRQPILSAVWAESQEWATQSSNLLKNWLSQTELFTVPKKAHWFSQQNEEGLAQGLAEFASRHVYG